MRVLIDGLVFGNTYQRGVQRYFQQLLPRLAPAADVALWLGERPAVELPAGAATVGWPEHGWRLRGQAGRRWRRLAAAAGRCAGCYPFWRPPGPYDLFHSTFYTRAPDPRWPEVVTVFDMIVERHPAMFGSWGRWHAREKRACLRAARRCLAISRQTADDVAALVPEAAGRVRVVHPGADHLLTAGPASVPAAPAGAGLPAGPFALFVGDRAGYKNFALALTALGEPGWPREVGLAVCGSPFTPAELRDIARRGLTGRVTHLGRPDDRTLAALYRAAACFLFPSLAEGFGFPLLEAQSQGAAVACSDIPVFHEVGGAGALYFDPADPAALARCVERAGTPAARRDLAQLGPANVARFTWDRCAQQTLQAYREAVA